ncbi:hypothetical protein ACFWIQ_11185 [Kitasatospora sp. NPDC127059]|uniref:hypothetical protein n=1 Tax=unclassified Kitasatospora TaxID=2633591 RepID=UPI00364B11FF
MLKDLGQVGVWLSGLGLEIGDLGEATVERFLADQRQAGRPPSAPGTAWDAAPARLSA